MFDGRGMLQRCYSDELPNYGEASFNSFGLIVYNVGREMENHRIPSRWSKENRKKSKTMENVQQ